MNKIKPLINGGSAALNIYAELPRLLIKNKHLALATVACTRGSAPQKTGNSAVFDEYSLLLGTIGGGIVEYSIQKTANDVVRSKHSALHTFNLTNQISDQEGAICGGNMEVLLDAEPAKHVSVFESIKKSLSKRESGVMLTRAWNESSGRLKIERDWITGNTVEEKGASLNTELYNSLMEMLEYPVQGAFRKIEFRETAEEQTHFICLETVVPPPRVIIAGAGHVGKALSHLGKMLGFEVIVWDYRSDYATKENLPDADMILSGNLNSSLAAVETDRNTYVVAVTTGHKHDMEVLKAFIGSHAGYIGMIGSRKKTILMREKFLAESWATEEQWERVYAPVGLDINSETVEEIAVSIAAQLIQVRHQLNKRQ